MLQENSSCTSESPRNTTYSQFSGYCFHFDVDYSWTLWSMDSQRHMGANGNPRRDTCSRRRRIGSGYVAGNRKAVRCKLTNEIRVHTNVLHRLPSLLDYLRLRNRLQLQTQL